MAQGQGRQQAPVGSRRGQDGSRWYNERPESKAVARWFKDSVPLDADMDHSRYVGGITLIEGWERSEELRQGQGGNVFPLKVRNLVFTPYMKVDARALYFKDWCLTRGYVGEVVPAVAFEGMRPGFFRREVKGVEYVGCSFQVRVWERHHLRYGPTQLSHGTIYGVIEGTPVMLPAPASKLVPVLTKVYDNGSWVAAPDVYADMKAETGALGRALGMAGMLVVPGSGVATAEDIQEMLAREATGAPLTAEDHAAAPSLPTATPPSEPLAGEPREGESSEDPDAPLRQAIEAALEQLKQANEDAYEEFQRWAREDRKFESLADLSGPQLRGVHRKLTSTLSRYVTTKA